MTEDQFGMIVGLLSEIRDSLAYLCAESEPPPEPADPPCDHPESSRLDMSTPRETHWQCGECGHVERRTRATHAPAQAPGADAKE